MEKNIKKIFYNLKIKYFKDIDKDGYGDLKGLGLQFDYFKYLQINSLILEDFLIKDINHNKLSLNLFNKKNGTSQDMFFALFHAKKNNIKVFVELDIDFFKNFNKLIENKNNLKNKNSKNFINKKSPLQDKNTNTEFVSYIKKLVKIINYWQSVGIKGFVFTNFEYLSGKKDEILNSQSLHILRKIFLEIKKNNIDIEIIGKSNILSINHAKKLIKEPTKIFDYFYSTKISQLEILKNNKINIWGKFSPKKLYKSIKTYALNKNNILSFGTEHVGRLISRWGNEGHYKTHSAKSFGMLLLLTPASASIYYGDEIGTQNIINPDLQINDLNEIKYKWYWRKKTKIKFKKNYLKYNSVFANNLMMWNNSENGGFSLSEKTIVMPSFEYKENNVENQYNDKYSILNFYKQLNKFIKSSSYSEILEQGKFKISFLFNGIIKYKYNLKKKIIILYSNINNTRKKINISKKGKIIFSSYFEKEYSEKITHLDPFETIIISKNLDTHLSVKQQMEIENNKMINKIEKQENLKKENELNVKEMKNIIDKK